MKVFIFSLMMVSLTVSLAGKEESDIRVSDRTLVQRCVIEGPSSRMIAVGQPGGFNYAFDAVHCAPVYVWQGGFLDFDGETNGRGGRGCKILGVAQSLGMDLIPLRNGKPDTIPESLRFQGYRRDSENGEPTFLFELNGKPVEQKVWSSGPGQVSMELIFPGKRNSAFYYLLDPAAHLRIDLGQGLRWSGPGVIEISTQVTTAQLSIYLKSTGRAFVREVEDLSGSDLFRNFCSACHSTDGTRLIGPSFLGLWGREQTVTRDGQSESVKVDADYIRESILEPQAAIVKGYEQVPMADFSSVLTHEQVDRLLIFLEEIE